MRDRKAALPIMDGGDEESVLVVVSNVGIVVAVVIEKVSLESGEGGREEGGEGELVVFWNWRSSACRS